MTELFLTTTDVRHAVEDGVSDIYHRIATTNNIPSGDESPNQSRRREVIEELLTDLVCEWLNQNDTRIEIVNQ